MSNLGPTTEQEQLKSVNLLITHLHTNRRLSIQDDFTNQSIIEDIDTSLLDQFVEKTISFIFTEWSC